MSYAGEEGLEAYGSEEVSDADVVAFTDDCIQLLKLLLKNRDMTLNEVKLILAIEDPRAQEARRRYGVEVSGKEKGDNVSLPRPSLSLSRAPAPARERCLALL